MSSGLHTAYRVVRRVGEGTAGVSLVLDGSLAAEPGQFVMAWLPGVEERPLAVMDDDPLSLTVCDVGPFTCAMCALRPGDRVWVRGPFGHGFRPEGRRHLLVGGGSGTASLALLAKVAREHEGEVVAAVGARTAEGLMLAWRLREAGARVVLATDDGSAGVPGTVVGAVAPFLAEKWPDAVYGCGPEPMLAALAERTAALGLPCWVSLERVMRCGIGLCGSCHCGERLVCADGPVFRAEDVFPCGRGDGGGEEGHD